MIHKRPAHRRRSFRCSSGFSSCERAPLLDQFFWLVWFKISPAHLIIAAKQNYIAQVKSRSRSAHREKRAACVWSGLSLQLVCANISRLSVFGLDGLTVLPSSCSPQQLPADLRQSLWHTKACERVNARGYYDQGQPRGGLPRTRDKCISFIKLKVQLHCSVLPAGRA